MAKNNDDLLALFNSRRTLSKSFGKKYKKEVEKALDDYNIESFDKKFLPDLHNKLQIPYIFSTVESSLPSLFDQFPPVYMAQGGKMDKEFSEFSQLVWEYIVRLTNLNWTIEETGFTFLLGGLGTTLVDWETDTETVEEELQIPLLNEDGTPVVDENGMPQIETVTQENEVIVKDQPVIKYLPYDEVYFSPESKFVVDDEDNKSIPYVIYKVSMDVDVASYIFNTEIEPTDEEIDLDKVDAHLDADIDKLNIDKDDIKRVSVYFYQGQLPKDKVEDWRPYRAYKAAFTTKQILEAPTQIEKKGIINIGNYGSPEEFYKFGEARVLRELEEDVSMGRSVIADYRDKLSTKVAVPHTTEFDEESFRSPKEFTIVKFIGDRYPQYITPPPIPETVLTSLGMSRDDIQMASAQLDISRGGTQSVVDTATGQKIFAQAQQKRIERKKGKLGEYIKAIAKNVLIMASQKWDVETFAQITDTNPEEIMQKGFIEKLSNIGTEYDLVIEIDDVVNNKEARAAQAIAMYREMKDVQMINQDELIRFVMKVGFNQKDTERFLSNQMSPEMLMSALQNMAQMGVMDPQMAQQHAMQLQMALQGGSPGGGGQVGRPSTANPVDVVNNSMAGSDTTQITAQNENVDKLMGARGPQNV
jgi:hypothetical protein